MAGRDALHVLVGVLVDEQGRVLIALRPEGKHMAGYWEFPGGKRRTGESRYAALCRELSEELGVSIEHAEPFVDHVHDYPDRRVRLDVWWIDEFTGQARPREGQALRWSDPADLDAAPLLRANQPIVTAILERMGL